MELGTIFGPSDWHVGPPQAEDRQFLESALIREDTMNDERKSSKAGERAAEGLRQAASKEEAKNESKMGHDLAKGADRFEERSKSSDGKSAGEKQKD